MTHPTLSRFAGLLGIGAALAAVPLASPLLVSLGLILAGVLVAYRCAAEVIREILPDLLAQGRAEACDPVVFRHVL